MSFTVAIRQCDQPLQVELGQTILDAALQQGIDYPHNCRAGNCSACKSRLYSGEVEMSPYSDFALSQAEKESGLILACRSVPWSDCEIAWLSDEDRVVHPQRELTCEVHEIVHATHDIVIVRLKVLSGGPFDFSAGQFADVEFDGQPSRQYSMANRPDQSLLEFHIRVVPGGRTSTFVNRDLKTGTRASVRGPGGTAYLRVKHTGPIVAVAGGSGLAPIKSIVETALYERLTQPIHMYFGVRDERDIYLEHHFQTLAFQHPNFRFTPVLSETKGDTQRRTGFVTDAVKQDFPSLAGFKAYLCGPPPMVEAAQRLVPTLGLADEDVHADAFYTQAELAAQGKSESKNP
jgi:ferredoxin-NAD(P)+ reductase (naphthalene dioxygenase ferredoxin-specific)